MPALLNSGRSHSRKSAEMMGGIRPEADIGLGLKSEQAVN